jgi:thioredoxin reductase
MSETYDVAIVGGGAAGLSVAILLGRCPRRVLLCHGRQPRNAAAQAVHYLLGHEGTPPRDLLTKGRLELEQYSTVPLRAGHVTEIIRAGKQFSVSCADGYTLVARKVLLAAGLKDDVPELEGIEQLYGRSVHDCPYCDGSSTGTNPSPSMAGATRGRVWR